MVGEVRYGVMCDKGCVQIAAHSYILDALVFVHLYHCCFIHNKHFIFLRYGSLLLVQEESTTVRDEDVTLRHVP